MKTFWENEGEPNADGVVAATIDLEDGSSVSRYTGATMKEVADKLLTAQGNASVRIKQLKSERPPEKLRSRQPLKPRALTASERMEATHDLSDPTKAPEAVSRIVAAAIGAPLTEVASRLAESDDEDAARIAAEETQRFLRQTPEFYPTQHNNHVLMSYAEKFVGDATCANFITAFEYLRDHGLLTPRPETTSTADGVLPEARTDEAQPSTSQTGVRTRPRLATTGLRNNDTSGQQPRTATRPASKWTKAGILMMNGDEYRKLFDNDPEFRTAVDALFAEDYAGSRRA